MKEELLKEKRSELFKQAAAIGRQIRGIDMVLTNNAPRDRASSKHKLITEEDLNNINIIIDVVGEVFGFDEFTYLGNGRKAPHARARHCAFYIAETACSCSLDDIGAMFSGYRDSNYDHSTVIHGKKRVADALYMKESKGIDPDGYAAKVEKCIALYLAKKSEV